MGSLPHVVEDCMGVLQVFSDGSIFRADEIDFRNIFVVENKSIVHKDYLYDKEHGLSLRLYRPASPPPPSGKLPIVYYLHGGGFCVGSRLWPNCHNCCTRLASGLGALVISPDYRLAPEHRLPAPIDDAHSALKWLQSKAKSEDVDGWLDPKAADFGRVYIVGDSSGGNIAHHLAVDLGFRSPKLAPVRVQGYVLLAPFFGGVARTKSEEGPCEGLLNLEILDRFWRLSVPSGGDRDHPLANPFGPLSPSLEAAALDPILVMVGGNEMLKDRVQDYAERLKGMGKNVKYVEYEGKQHGFFTNDAYSDAGNQVIQEIREFMLESSK
ncbi:probable carboxylesterase 15 [Eucalyptus grandis]|uniref:probable carboxylesterase 15 n=1 Tax=Eucalyptus grandis TaxID=71139 RepID=UPI00192EEAE1|nr:probable carboxylesterase 15 [Eucalyptus grandis]